MVARTDGRVRLRIPRSVDPGQLLRIADSDVVRLSYEPPTLSELFRAAVLEARETATEVRDDHA